jgi:hypothetical protein
VLFETLEFQKQNQRRKDGVIGIRHRGDHGLHIRASGSGEISPKYLCEPSGRALQGCVAIECNRLGQTGTLVVAALTIHGGPGAVDIRGDAVELPASDCLKI